MGRGLLSGLLVVLLALSIAACARDTTPSPAEQSRKPGFRATAHRLFGERLLEVGSTQESATWFVGYAAVETTAYDSRWAYELLESMRHSTPRDAVLSLRIMTVESSGTAVERYYDWNRSAERQWACGSTMFGRELMMFAGKRPWPPGQDGPVQRSARALGARGVDDAFIAAVAEGTRKPPKESAVKLEYPL